MKCLQFQLISKHLASWEECQWSFYSLANKLAGGKAQERIVFALASGTIVNWPWAHYSEEVTSHPETSLQKKCLTQKEAWFRIAFVFLKLLPFPPLTMSGPGFQTQTLGVTNSLSCGVDGYSYGHGAKRVRVCWSQLLLRPPRFSSFGMLFICYIWLTKNR